ncbi:MAG: AAA family ATPase [Paludibacteraceae bacterium]|nr:AAA family ATPase [Paludibacteraceae bacterium]
MINDFLYKRVIGHFPHTPTQQQDELIQKLSGFVIDRTPGIFLLKGYAGTGKTSVIAALIKAMDELQQAIILMAPTGRAAKVLSSYSGKQAYTIHKKIYRQHIGGEINGDFSLNANLHKGTLFVVDEASMIANASGESNFGSGRLLDDLIEFVYGGDGCKMILIGDTAQLPPVGQVMSPALEKGHLEGYGFPVEEYRLTDVVRQACESGILYNATKLRLHILEELSGVIPDIEIDPYTDIKHVSGEELIEEISSSFSQVGMDETIVISRSNKRANIFNNGIRNRILYREEELSSGDLLMVVRNNYFWSKGIEKFDFIANGDIAEVKRIRNKRELYGFRFADVQLYFPDYDIELEAKIVLDTLQSEAPALSYDDQNRLFQAVQEDYMEIGNKRERMKKMREDPYLNALQVKFAYAVTCHKAQGGQWKNVFLDQGYLTDEMINTEYLRWLYTAFTRAKSKLYLVNWPKKN